MPDVLSTIMPGIAQGLENITTQANKASAVSSAQNQALEQDWQKALNLTSEKNSSTSQTSRRLPGFSSNSSNGLEGVRSNRATAIASPSGASSSSAENHPLKAFESMTISFFLKEAFKNDMGKAFGDGMAADFYTSLFVDAAAEQIVEAGGLGISKMLEQHGAQSPATLPAESKLGKSGHG